MNRDWRQRVLSQLGERYPALRKIPAWGWAGIGIVFLVGCAVLLKWLAPKPEVQQDSGVLDSTLLGIDVLLKLAVVVLLIYIAAALANRWRSPQTQRREKQLAILETARLTPRQAIHLVRVGERVIVVGATDHTLSLLTEVEGDAAGDVETTGFSICQVGQNAGNSFSDIMKSL